MCIEDYGAQRRVEGMQVEYRGVVCRLPGRLFMLGMVAAQESFP